MKKTFPAKLFCLLVASLFITANSYAALSGNIVSDAKLALQIKLQQLKSYQADFTQKVVDIENTVLQEARGNIVLQQPNKLYWELLAPNDNILLADGQTLWNIDPFMEQVVAYNQDSAIENNPLILLTDPSSNKWLEFNVMVKDKEFIISPIQQTGSVETLRLVFDRQDKLVQLETTDVQKQTSTLTFSNILQNKTLTTNKFVFTMPEGYELDDQRAL
ncbi:outer membrane lipoprotein chaperone LolA [Paraglaciecola sp. L3A3]|uniref:outer membrane lipoprotein chaperone LolA n=1 Tax=Paraglaciecola sp. L3A3 TaxID=2686358 RepID=UPI00131DC0BD|nr:outer membrane lipoprotein chaperone LolA [Paraglaciecola sp. L3A3]